MSVRPAQLARWPLLCLAALCLLMGLAAPAAFGFASTLPASSVPALQTASAVSPAQATFNEANDTLEYQYGGLSTVDRAGLRATYQERLDLICSRRPKCPSLQAYPVLSAELTALNDPHSFIQDPDEFTDFVASATGGNRLQFGVRLAAFEGENRLVLEVLPRSASADAGLRRGDLLETLNAQPFRYEALKVAREAGRSIQLGVRRGGKVFQVTLTPRESSTRELPTLNWLTVPASVSSSAAVRRVALIRVPTFLSAGEVGQSVHDQVRRAQSGHAAGIIVDLRGNPGGDLSECDTAVSAFVPSFSRISQSPQNISRMVVTGGARYEDGLMLSSVAFPALWQGPLAVLVDGGSASCSEFFAYEVQYARQQATRSIVHRPIVQAPPRLVVGEATAGVGNTATRLFPLMGGGALQLTTLHYVKPDNQPYPLRITPDVTATTDPFMLTQSKDSMVQTALSVLLRSR